MTLLDDTHIARHLGWPAVIVTDKQWISEELIIFLKQIVAVRWCYEKTPPEGSGICLRFKSLTDASLASLALANYVPPEGKVGIVSISH